MIQSVAEVGRRNSIRENPTGYIEREVRKQLAGAAEPHRINLGVRHAIAGYARRIPVEQCIQAGIDKALEEPNQPRSNQ